MSPISKPHPFIVYGPGFSGDCETREGAEGIVRTNGNGHVYVPLAELDAAEPEVCT